MVIIAKVTSEIKTYMYGVLLVCFVCFIWAVMETIIAHIPGKYSLYQVVWVRYATHILFMLLVFGPRHHIKLVHTHRLGLQLLRAFMMFIMPVSYILALHYMPVVNIVALFWLTPLIIIVLSVLFLNERVSWAYWIITFVGLAFTLVIINPNRNVTGTGAILALTSGLSLSLYLVMTRLLRDEEILASLFYTAGGVLLPLTIGLPAFWKPLTLQSGLMMGTIGLLGFILLLELDKALEKTPASILAPLFFIYPLWMILLHYLVKIIPI